MPHSPGPVRHAPRLAQKPRPKAMLIPFGVTVMSRREWAGFPYHCASENLIERHLT